ncbi:MAG: hypothetical protein WBQ26_07910 [Gemmatimonadaceae bacterium]|nr:hypothetical protein [Gemmatimonadaceae bacterium]
MIAPSRSSRPLNTRLMRRVALFALFALELVVAFAPLMEPDHEATKSHVEETGTQHQFLVHDDANCAVCALRSITALPSGRAVVLPNAHTQLVAAAQVHFTVTTGTEAANPSRAPPIFG